MKKKLRGEVTVGIQPPYTLGASIHVRAFGARLGRLNRNPVSAPGHVTLCGTPCTRHLHRCQLVSSFDIVFGNNRRDCLRPTLFTMRS